MKIRINSLAGNCRRRRAFVAKRLLPIGNFFTSPGILSEKMYAYAAYDLTETKQALEEGEEIERTSSAAAGGDCDVWRWANR